MELEISCATVHSMLQSGRDVLLLDCRDREEHQLARIEQAVLIPMGEIAHRLQELEPFRDHEVVVHCHHGGRSLKVANWLRQQGFTKVRSMAGGIDAWATEIDPRVGRY